MDNKTFAFIDESGNTDLDIAKNGVSKYFVLTAIVVPEERLQSLTIEVAKLRDFYFQTGEMKSSGVKNNRERRAKILSAFAKLDFKFYTLCIDKERINEDSGLRYKKTFFKYLNGRLYNLLYKTYFNLHIKADEHGRKDFMLSFEEYIEKNHKPDLLFRSDFDFVNSENEVLVQLADFIAGTINKIYQDNVKDSLSEAYIDFISSDNALSIDEWPTKYTAYRPKEKASGEFSDLIYKLALGRAEIYIDQNLNDHNSETKMQVAFLRHLVFQSRMVDKQKYISTSKIRTFLEESGFGAISQHTVRSKIVGPLRDSEVIVTSSNKGYKIPCSFDDMQEFVERVQSIVVPLLSRLSKARTSLKMASGNDVDILKGPNYPTLVRLLDEIEKKI